MYSIEYQTKSVLYFHKCINNNNGKFWYLNIENASHEFKMDEKISWIIWRLVLKGFYFLQCNLDSITYTNFFILHITKVYWPSLVISMRLKWMRNHITWHLHRITWISPKIAYYFYYIYFAYYYHIEQTKNLW